MTNKCYGCFGAANNDCELCIEREERMITEDILKTEYCERFDEIRKKQMLMSYHKYGPVKDNYDRFKSMDALGNIEKRIQKYKETGNTEFLADAANFAMIEFMYPSIPGAAYVPTDSGACETIGFGVNELKNGGKW